VQFCFHGILIILKKKLIILQSLIVSLFPTDDGAGLGAPALGTAPALLEASF